MSKIFFSHAWTKDKLGRNTHYRVLELYNNLKNIGWNIWIDENEIKSNIDADITQGINSSDVIIVFLTDGYIKKVNENANNPYSRDNCLKEWTYMNFCKKFIIPIVFEPYLLNFDNWNSGIISLYIGSTLYLDCTSNNLNENTQKIHNHLIKLGFTNSKSKKNIYIEKIKNFKSYSFFRSKKILPLNEFNNPNLNFNNTSNDTLNNYFTNKLKSHRPAPILVK